MNSFHSTANIHRTANRISMSEFQEASLSPHSKLTPIMADTIANLKKIKEIHLRISEANETDIKPFTFPSKTGFSPSSSKTQGPFVLNGQSAKTMAVSVCACILAHAGFDGKSCLLIIVVSYSRYHSLSMPRKRLGSLCGHFQ